MRTTFHLDLDHTGIRLRRGSGKGQSILGEVALDDLSAVLDGAVGAGTNRLDGLSYGLLDPAPVRDAALAAAVEDGLRKAAVLAEAAGLTIGAPLAVVEQGGSRPPGPVMMEMASMDRSIPTAPGSLEVTAQVELRFAIRP